MIDKVQILVTVGLNRNVACDIAPDEQVQEEVLKAVEHTLQYDVLAGQLSKVLGGNVLLAYHNTDIKLVIAPEPHDPGDQERLEHARHEAADKYYGEFDFGDNVVEDANGWNHIVGQNGWDRTVFFQNDQEDKDGFTPSVKGKFYIKFKDGTDEIEDGDYSLED